MPVLMLMRHGKSSWDAPWERDHDRPLAPRGVKAAGRIGRFISEAGLRPQLVVSSTAVRAETTARLAAESGGWDCRVESDGELYGGGVQAVLGRVRQLPDDLERVVLVGHNPTWALATSALIGGGEIRFPTAAAACIGFEVPWRRLDVGAGELRWFIIPRALG
jgi:phosphohistidine phosphatase